jgi:hypothetical protein
MKCIVRNLGEVQNLVEVGYQPFQAAFGKYSIGSMLKTLAQ